jgi:hypothetical protein
MAESGFLMNFPVLVEFPAGTSPEEPDSPVWELAERVQGAINQIVEEHGAQRDGCGEGAGREVGCHQVVVRELDPSRFNCGRCAECGAWTTDWLAPERIEALRRGILVGGVLLCEDELDERQMLKLYPPA